MRGQQIYSRCPAISLTRSSGGRNNETPQDVQRLCNRPTFWPAGSQQKDVIGKYDLTTRLLGESYNPASNSSTPRTQTRSRSKVKEFFCHKSLDGWQARASRDVSLSSSSSSSSPPPRPRRPLSQVRYLPLLSVNTFTLSSSAAVPWISSPRDACGDGGRGDGGHHQCLTN